MAATVTGVFGEHFDLDLSKSTLRGKARLRALCGTATAAAVATI